MTDRVEWVQYEATCDCGCGGDATWNGTVAETGGGTAYSPPRCHAGREDTPISGNPLAPGDVVDSRPLNRNIALAFIADLLNRRTA